MAAARLPDLARIAPKFFAEGTCAQVYQQLTRAVRERILQNGPRVRVLAVRRSIGKEGPVQPALLSMGQNMALMRTAQHSELAWQTEVSAERRGARSQ